MYKMYQIKPGLFHSLFCLYLSSEGRSLAWKFVKDNWKEFYDRYQGGFLLGRLVKVCILKMLLKSNLMKPNCIFKA